MRMRLLLIGLFVGCALVLTIGAEYAGRTIIQTGWQVLRAEAIEDSTTIDLTTKGNFANKPTAAKTIPDIDTLSTTARKIACITCASAAANKTYTIHYIGWAAENGPAQRICDIGYTTGTQAVIKYPHSGATATNRFWADTASVTGYRAFPVEVCDSSGDNGVAEVTFYTEGLKYLYAEVVDANGTGVEANNVTVYWRQKN